MLSRQMLTGGAILPFHQVRGSESNSGSAPVYQPSKTTGAVLSQEFSIHGQLERSLQRLTILESFLCTFVSHLLCSMFKNQLIDNQLRKRKVEGNSNCERFLSQRGLWPLTPLTQHSPLSVRSCVATCDNIPTSVSWNLLYLRSLVSLFQSTKSCHLRPVRLSSSCPSSLNWKDTHSIIRSCLDYVCSPTPQSSD